MVKKHNKVMKTTDFLYHKIDDVRKSMDLLSDIQGQYWTTDKISHNLSKRLRPYQEEAMWNFNYTQKIKQPLNHVLFNIATGGGKTLIMASCILYLFHEFGYKNFLFFANTDAIVKKTNDNLLNISSEKYLFDKNISMDSRHIQIKQVEQFPKVADKNTIYLVLTSIQKLHTDLNNPKENGLCYEDLQENPIVMLADEAHHYNAQTTGKSNKNNESAWELTIQKVLSLRQDNKLLEFTATLDTNEQSLYKKYKDKIVYKYDLKEFMQQGYSKLVMLLETDSNDSQKMLEAVLLSQYRKLIAIKYGVLGFKPVVLFKSNTIRTSEMAHELFVNMINNLEPIKVQEYIGIKKQQVKEKPSSIWHKMADFYLGCNNFGEIIKGIQEDFHELNIYNANSEDILKDDNGFILNSLEDINNPYRAIFAVAKLNEGWDVLNLYDIVRIKENGTATSKSTTSEAQLIGRGARYYPFALPAQNISQIRQFDNSTNELAVLEQLHYHTMNDSDYIKLLHQSLINEQVLSQADGNKKLVFVKVKDSFKKSKIYKHGKLYINEQYKPSSKSNFKEYSISNKVIVSYRKTDEKLLTDIKANDGLVIFAEEAPVIRLTKPFYRKAIMRNPFFKFDNLKNYFPNLHSIDEFITHTHYLGGLEIGVYNLPLDFDFDEMSPKDRLEILERALVKVSESIRKNYGKAHGTGHFIGININDIVKDHELLIDEVNAPNLPNDNTQVVEARDIGRGANWFVFDTLVCNGLEYKMVLALKRAIGKLSNQYDEIYLIRNNENTAGLKLTQFKGVKGFKPDFLLLMKDSDREYFYHVFLEAKGEAFYEQDKWKEDMLELINGNKEICITVDEVNVRLIGVQFFREGQVNENAFKRDFYNKVVKNKALLLEENLFSLEDDKTKKGSSLVDQLSMFE